MATLRQIQGQHDDLRRIGESIQENMPTNGQPVTDRLDWENSPVEKWVRLDSIQEHLVEHGEKISGLNISGLKVERWVRLKPGPRVYQTPEDKPDNPAASRTKSRSPVRHPLGAMQ